MSGRDLPSAVPVTKAWRTSSNRRHKLQDALEAAESRIAELTSALAVAHSQRKEANTAALNLSKRLASMVDENLKLHILLSLSGQAAVAAHHSRPLGLRRHRRLHQGPPFSTKEDPKRGAS